MFRKTTAIAVLILLLSSSFAGSVTITRGGQTDADTAGQTVLAQEGGHRAISASTGTVSGADSSGTPAGDGPIFFERGLESFVFYGTTGEPGAAIVTGDVPAAVAKKLMGIGHRGFPWFGLMAGAPGLAMIEASGEPSAGYSTSVTVDDSSAPTTMPMPHAFAFTGNVTGADGGLVMVGGSYAYDFSGMDTPGEHHAGKRTMLIDMNNSSLVMTEPAPHPFAFTGNVTEVGRESVRAIDRSWMTDAGPMNLSIRSPVHMLGADGAELGMYEMMWEAGHVMAGEAGPVEFFARFPIPGYDGGGEFNGSMVVNLSGDVLASVTHAQDSAAEASPYDNEISGGETNWHTVNVGDVKSLNVDLKWNNASDSLRLVIYTPDGKILGPYDDASDGSVDGRINLNIANPSGVAQGAWYLKVTDTSLLGKDAYYVKTY
ncbi:MAG TPA: hypothetical protein VLT35_03470 [Methanocella sp.]|nr:hypothetical protein [Methanocella sp.]